MVSQLYTIQQSRGFIHIDEVDLVRLVLRVSFPLRILTDSSSPPSFIFIFQLPSSLTSRHSLLLTVLSQVFLYHGRGSLRSERIAGRQYAALLAKDSPSEFIELEEDGRKTEDHELFWMCFGEEKGEGSRAEHWRFRGGLEEDEVTGWRVEKGKVRLPTFLRCSRSRSEELTLPDFLPSQVTPMNSLLSGEVFGPGIKILLLSFEIFVVVSEEARGRREDVRFALHIASVRLYQSSHQQSLNRSKN